MTASWQPGSGAGRTQTLSKRPLARREWTAAASR